MSSLYILDINLVSEMSFASIFSHSVVDLFTLLIISFTIQKIFSLIFNLYAEYIMRNAGLEETQAGNKIAGRNINKLRYADDSTLVT